MKPSMEWLVLRAQSGDRAAMESLLMETQRALAGYVFAMRRDAEAADVMQEILITIYRKLGSLQEPRAYLAWARRIASRSVMAASRRLRETDMTQMELNEAREELAVAPEDAHLVRDLRALLRRVSPAAREVLVMHYLQDLSIEEVAAVLDVPAGTVKSRLAYGLRALRKLAASLP